MSCTVAFVTFWSSKLGLALGILYDHIFIYLGVSTNTEVQSKNNHKNNETKNKTRKVRKHWLTL